MKELIVSVLFVSASLGAYLPGVSLAGYNFYAFRALVVIIIIILLSKRLPSRRSLITTEAYRSFLLVALGFIVWGTVSLLWTGSVLSGTGEILSIAIMLSFVSAILLLVPGEDAGFRMISSGWVSAFVVTSAISMWEIYSGDHLPSDWALDTPAYAIVGKIASSFRNPNDYGSFLILALPVFLYSTVASRSKLARLVFLVIVVVGLILSALTTSRIGLAGYVLILLYWMIARANASFALANKFLLPLIVVFFILYFSSFGVSQLSDSFSRFGTVGYELRNAGSAEIRLNMILNTLAAVVYSFGFGLGAGSFESWVGSRSAPYFVGDIVNAHNLCLEIASQYGVVVFGLVIWWLRKCFRSARRASADALAGKRLVGITLHCLLFSYLIAGFSSSSLLTSNLNNLCVATIVLLGAMLERSTARHRSV